MRTRKKMFLLAFAILCAGIPAATGAAYAQNQQGKMISPEEVISIVLSQNPSLAEMEEAAIAASARIEPAGALDDPALTYALAPATIGNRSLDTGQRVEIGQSLPWPGKLSAQEDAARERASAARETEVLQRLNVIAAAKAAFAEWYFVFEALRLNRENQRLLEDLRASAEARFAAGRGLQQDVLQAEVEIALLDDRRLVLQQQREAVRARLNALMNRRPDAALPPPSALPAAPLPAPLPALVERAAVHHPELRRLQHQFAEKSADIRLAEKEFYPDFRVAAGYNSLWDAQDKRWSFGVSVNIPLNRSRRHAEVSAARADRRRVEWQLADRRNELLAELARIRAEVDRAAGSIDLFEERLLPLSENTLEVSVSEYRSGAGDFLNVIVAERNKLRIEDSLFRARADHYRSRAELEFWVGGPLESTPSTNSPDEAERTLEREGDQ